ncbi:hypothetical protein M3Y98_00899300 [Aphelenchoides besseyi]|nr:hypothetical protein M3Y98_00899300 [Aphelenchoides besseyi]
MAFLRGSMRTPKTISEILTALGIVLLVVLIALSIALYCFWFRRDKRKKKAAREVIKENARIGQRVTDEQARALYELNDSWEKFWKCAEQEKDSRRLSKRSVQCVNYFRLLIWAKKTT